MGLRFRRSKNFGPFRINLSKSGIGTSFGVKGIRVTHKANGGMRTTLSIPGTGISYVSETGSSKRRKQKELSYKEKRRRVKKENHLSESQMRKLERRAKKNPNQYIGKSNEEIVASVKTNPIISILKFLIIFPFKLMYYCLLFCIPIPGWKILFNKMRG